VEKENFNDGWVPNNPDVLLACLGTTGLDFPPVILGFFAPFTPRPWGALPSPIFLFFFKDPPVV